MRELQALQNKQIQNSLDACIQGSFLFAQFYSAPARHEQEAKLLRMVQRVIEVQPTHDKSHVKNVTYGRCIGTISIVILLM